MAEGAPRKKVNTYVINSIPRPICNVQFKVLPFYRNIYKITVEPVAIYCVPTYKPGLNEAKGTDLIKKK